MIEAHEEIAAREQAVNRLIADYLEAERNGRAQDREELLRQHPDLAGELLSFIADKDQFERLAEPIPRSPRSGQILPPARRANCQPSARPSPPQRPRPRDSTSATMRCWPRLREEAWA